MRATLAALRSRAAPPPPIKREITEGPFDQAQDRHPSDSLSGGLPPPEPPPDLLDVTLSPSFARLFGAWGRAGRLQMHTRDVDIRGRGLSLVTLEKAAGEDAIRPEKTKARARAGAGGIRHHVGSHGGGDAAAAGWLGNAS